MWISKNDWLDLKLRAEISQDTSKQWEKNYKDLYEQVTDHRLHRESEYYTKAGYRELESKHNQDKRELSQTITRLEAELASIKSVLVWKDQFIASLTQLIKTKEITND